MNENFSSVEVGNRIDAKMKDLNLKQKDLVKMTGLSKNAISNYISGNRIPDTTSIYKLSTVLKVSIEWLLTGISINDNATMTHNFTQNTLTATYSTKQLQVIENISKLNDERLAEVSGFVLSQLLEQEKVSGADEMSAGLNKTNSALSSTSGSGSSLEPKVG